DDLLVLCIRAIETGSEFAAAQRWQFGHLFVDEFQDVNPLQFRLLEAWRGDRRDLCVVGDPNQAIYAWNGAEPTLITKLATRVPGTETVTLERNYRSTPQIVATANRVLECAAAATLRLRATRPEGPIPRVTSHDTDVDEAHAIARTIARHHAPDTPWSHHAVLTRTNAQAVLLADAVRRRAGARAQPGRAGPIGQRVLGGRPLTHGLGLRGLAERHCRLRRRRQRGRRGRRGYVPRGQGTRMAGRAPRRTRGRARS